MIACVFSDLIGRPYNKDSFNCWHLVIEIYRRLGYDVPDFTPKSQSFVRAFIRHLNTGKHGFEKVDKPSNYDVMILKNHHTIHCGLYINGEVLHNHGHGYNGQVELSLLHDIKDVYEIEYYQWQS